MDVVRVMIVDDHPLVREGLRALLARSDKVRVTAECSDGEEAVAKIKASPTDVVLLDWMMPRMDGLEACRRMKASRPETGILMLTNHLDGESVKNALRAGALGYLLKDVTFEDLESAILDAARGKGTFH